MSLPIRVRLTAWYVALLAVILTALGAFVVLRLRADLQERVDREVRRVAVDIGAGYGAGGTEELIALSRAALPRTGSAVQVLDRAGRVLVSFGAGDARTAMVPMRVRAEALLGEPQVTGVTLGEREAHFRAAVTSVRRLGRRHLLVVAQSLEGAEASVRRVLALLLPAGLAALAATALVGWWLARKALLPVDRMASAAAAIEIDRLERRLVVPRARDELSHLALTLNAMLDRLERGVGEKRRLVADASHELRTPLAVMRAELDVSLRSPDLGEEAREVLESAREEVRHMSRVADNLLTLAQVDEGRLGLLRRPLELADAIEEAARPLRALAASRRIELSVGGEPASAVADPQHLHRALTNLIENAIKFSPPGSEVRVTTWRRDGEVGVTVADQGPGIPAEARSHVFDRFYRVDRSRSRAVGGSGLGLAICREVAVAHGGRVEVESEEGRGSAFKLALPREDVTAPA